MKVFLTGATGFVGSHVADALLDAGHDVTALVRPGSEDKLDSDVRDAIELCKGNILHKQTVKRGCEDCDAIINLVGIIREFPTKGITFEKLHVEATFNCVRAAQDHNIDLFVQMSALGTRDDASSAYHRTKWQAEVLVRNAGFDHTIIRPSIIFGPGENGLAAIIDQVKSSPVVPLIGLGRNKLQPVYVEDVAAGIVASLNCDVSCVEMGGPTVYIYKGLVKSIARSLDERVVTVPVPKFLVWIPTVLLQYRAWYPLGVDMLKMLSEDNVVDGDNFDGLDVEPTALETFLQTR